MENYGGGRNKTPSEDLWIKASSKRRQDSKQMINAIIPKGAAGAAHN